MSPAAWAALRLGSSELGQLARGWAPSERCRRAPSRSIRVCHGAGKRRARRLPWPEAAVRQGYPAPVRYWPAAASPAPVLAVSRQVHCQPASSRSGRDCRSAQQRQVPWPVEHQEPPVPARYWPAAAWPQPAAALSCQEQHWRVLAPGYPASPSAGWSRSVASAPCPAGSGRRAARPPAARPGLPGWHGRQLPAPDCPDRAPAPRRGEVPAGD